MKVTLLTLSFLAFIFAFSGETFAVDLTVNLTTDQHDANTADNLCDIDLSTAGNQCTLRAAVEQTNAIPNSSDRIFFSLPGNSTITLTEAGGGEIAISGTLEIIGTGANNLTVDGGAGANRIFYINSSNVAISGVTLTGGNGVGGGGNLTGSGGAILVFGFSLTLDGVHLTGNTGLIGGGIYYYTLGNHVIRNSTFSNNTATQSCGGFVFNESAGNTLTIVNSTISGNTAASGAGGGFCTASGGNVVLRNSTITNNTATNSAGGLSHSTGNLNLGNTIIAGNSTTSGNTREINFTSGTITSTGGNLVGDAAGDSTSTGANSITYQASDIRDTNPLLGQLQNNGGTTPTHKLLTGSPAIDTGLDALAVDPSNGNAALANDQRGPGFGRVRDGDENGSAIVDIGSYEVQEITLVVNTTDDTVVGECDAAHCSLREAVSAANSSANASEITFAIPANDPNCPAGVCTITLTGGTLFISTAATSGALTITNTTGADNLLISGNNVSQVFNMNSGADLTLNGLTVTKGVSAGGGGGVLNNAGSLKITNSIVSENTAQSSNGGGIAVINGTANIVNSTVTGNNAFAGAGILSFSSTVNVSNSVISGNIASADAGGVYNQNGSTAIVNSTISGNTAAGNGGGVLNTGATGTVTLIDSTVSGNNAGDGGGGIYNASGALSLTTSTISGNTAVAGPGGGIRNNSGGALTVTSSTVSGNIAQNGAGGGVFNSGTAASLTNATISGNTAAGNGGGIFSNNGTLNLTSVTITNNGSTSAACGSCAGGVQSFATANVNNTIIAGNTTANAASPKDFGGTITSGSYNIIGNNQGTVGVTNGVNGNQVGTPANPIDPRLDPLANNVGLTQTHALKLDSPAIDKGNRFNLSTDQRGLIRPVDLIDAIYPDTADAADIGAFEVQSIPGTDLSITKTDSPDPAVAGTNLSYTITVTNNGPGAAANVAWNDTVPAETTFVSLSSPGGWTCTTPAVGAAGAVSCSNPALAAGNAVFTLVVNIPFGTPNATVISNTAAVSSSTFDPNAGNNSATATTTVNNPVQMSPIADQIGFVGQGIIVQASASSSVGAVTYSFVKTDGLFGFIDPSTGVMSFQKPVQEGKNHTITVRASSGANFAEQTFQVKWIFSWLGFTSPNENGSSVFGRTAQTVVPVKFKLGFNAAEAKAKLFVAPSNNLAAETAAKSSDGKTQFVYNSATKEYQFNWKPFGLAAGSYRLRVDLGDGELHTVFVTLK